MKEMNNMKAYVAPMVEVMNARVEKGFQGSGSESVTPSGETVDNNGNNYSLIDVDFD